MALEAHMPYRSFGRITWLFVGGMGAAALACGSSTGGGSGGHAAGSSTSASSGTASNTGGSDAGGGCHGDAATWASLTQGPIACTQNSDCCVIVNGCLSESQIVAATKKDQAKAAWPYCDSMCNNCIPPPVDVACSNGTCVGTVVPFQDAGPDLFMDHCGVNALAGTPSTQLHFSCGG
jgi:hypothetical protein